MRKQSRRLPRLAASHRSHHFVFPGIVFTTKEAVVLVLAREARPRLVRPRLAWPLSTRSPATKSP
eukprot:3678030-Prorocentrum_lima.AAC.1